VIKRGSRGSAPGIDRRTQIEVIGQRLSGDLRTGVAQMTVVGKIQLEARAARIIVVLP